MTRPIAPAAEEKPVRELRCAVCDRPFTGVIFVSLLTPGRFCTDACRSRAEDLVHMKANR